MSPLTIFTLRNELHEDVFSGHEGELSHDMAVNDGRIHHKAAANVI